MLSEIRQIYPDPGFRLQGAQGLIEPETGRNPEARVKVGVRRVFELAIRGRILRVEFGGIVWYGSVGTRFRPMIELLAALVGRVMCSE